MAIKMDCKFCFGRGMIGHMDDPCSTCPKCQGSGNISFADWVKELEGLDDVVRGYGVPLSETTGLECWHGFFDSGYSPQEAIAEDMTYWED